MSETKEVIMTDNEVVAKYMCVLVFKDHSEVEAYPIEKLTQWSYLVELKYNSSWAELMPVVEKIMQSADVMITNKDCMISKDGVVISGAYDGSIIENVFSSVVRFILSQNLIKLTDIINEENRLP